MQRSVLFTGIIISLILIANSTEVSAGKAKGILNLKTPKMELAPQALWQSASQTLISTETAIIENNATIANCAAYALSGLLAENGSTVDSAVLYQQLSPYTRYDGQTSADGIQQVAADYGVTLNGKELRLSELKKILKAGEDAIAHLNLDNGIGDYAFIESIAKGRVTYQNYTETLVMKKKEFRALWDGIALTTADIGTAVDSKQLEDIWGAWTPTYSYAYSSAGSSYYSPQRYYDNNLGSYAVSFEGKDAPSSPIYSSGIETVSLYSSLYSNIDTFSQSFDYISTPQTYNYSRYIVNLPAYNSTGFMPVSTKTANILPQRFYLPDYRLKVNRITPEVKKAVDFFNLGGWRIYSESVNRNKS